MIIWISGIYRIQKQQPFPINKNQKRPSRERKISWKVSTYFVLRGTSIYNRKAFHSPVMWNNLIMYFFFGFLSYSSERFSPDGKFFAVLASNAFLMLRAPGDLIDKFQCWYRELMKMKSTWAGFALCIREYQSEAGCIISPDDTSAFLQAAGWRTACKRAKIPPPDPANPPRKENVVCRFDGTSGSAIGQSGFLLFKEFDT